MVYAEQHISLVARPIMPSSYRQVLSREHERARRRILQVQDELAMLDRAELWPPFSEDEYCNLLDAELEAAVEAIEGAGTANSCPTCGNKASDAGALI